MNYLDKVSLVTPESSRKSKSGPVIVCITGVSETLGQQRRGEMLENINLAKKIQIKHQSRVKLPEVPF